MRKLVLRPVIVVCGLTAILWATVAIRAYSKDAPLAYTAKAILSGDKFNSKQMESIKEQIVVTSDLREASALSGAAVVRMFLLENEIKSGNREISVLDYERLQANVSEALARSPTDSFMWLAAFWLKRLRNDELTTDDFNLLRMSYRSGPNEGWIVFKRIPLALGASEKAPADLADKALWDIIGLVRSGFYWEAAGIFEGLGSDVRNQTLSRLLRVDLSSRRAFARALADKGISGLVIPGVEDRPFRPF